MSNTERSLAYEKISYALRDLIFEKNDRLPSLLSRRIMDILNGTSWRTIRLRKFTRDVNQRDRRWSIHVPVTEPSSDNVLPLNTVGDSYSGIP